MRRRLSWAAVGTSGVLAVIVATTMNPPSDSASQRPRIIVPQGEELDGYLPDWDPAQPETVFIPVVPPVAVTSATSTVSPPPRPALKPKKTTPAPPPANTTPPKTTPPKATLPKTPAPVTPSYWDYYRYWEHYHRYGDRNRYGDRDWRRSRDSGGYR